MDIAAYLLTSDREGHFQFKTVLEVHAHQSLLILLKCIFIKDSLRFLPFVTAFRPTTFLQMTQLPSNGIARCMIGAFLR